MDVHSVSTLTVLTYEAGARLSLYQVVAEASTTT